ncbi:polyprenyl diphosphate synthase [Methanimicrococcus blatticola]|uniref:Tritrans,polycis-undecaprenyl-diphosphate synthase (geranylgeranyl-diphosphate specific) n=1 Tax=Methanimicrococcus blatticola TaxID=91560 RepID=A0A484F462_9EURY|nr:polyprenyl diphosphate synthase [Methanimicrococcus blatticola]MBZ3935633.1 di-trans,poly-cis-decaprenylcistransferase [Methanimicrococcus blatticola]MCC2509274.1 di-trans,poly-cis-decaprenylcistransferase [Methanimicrococcus blatticola]TDQ69361.1 undecaprenyl pyrophosphate synthetase [Methanimicrococcus blatticola]
MPQKRKNSRTFLRSAEYIPEHIAFIMDGNRRYAHRKGKEANWGHTAGVSAVENLLHWTYLAKIKHITIYAFSTENFKRNPTEVESIFELLEKMLYKLSTDEKILSKKIRIRMIGETDNLPEKTLSAFKDLEEKTAGNDKMFLNVALAYGGRNDITQAFERIAEEAVLPENKEKPAGDFLSDDEISKFLFPFSDEIVPGVDFLIRTGDERRTSNFLPWQANGNNAVVCYYNKFWPEFTFKDLFYTLRIYGRMEEDRRKDEERRQKKIDAFLADLKS